MFRQRRDEFEEGALVLDAVDLVEHQDGPFDVLGKAGDERFRLFV